MIDEFTEQKLERLLDDTERLYTGRLSIGNVADRFQEMLRHFSTRLKDAENEINRHTQWVEDEIDELEAEVNELEQKNEELEQIVEDLKEALEKARQEVRS